MSKTDKHETGLNDIELEQFFAAGRSEQVEPSEALMARVLADAEAETHTRHAAKPRHRATPRAGVFASLRAALGGWPVMASMATATAAGIWIGAAAPDRLSTVTGGLIGSATSAQYELDELLPGYGAMAAYEEVAR